jgi:chaperone BCS1
LHITCANFC